MAIQLDEPRAKTEAEARATRATRECAGRLSEREKAAWGVGGADVGVMRDPPRSTIHITVLRKHPVPSSAARSQCRLVNCMRDSALQ